MFWVLPAISYREGLEKREGGKLVWWCLTVFVHVLGMDLSCVMIIYNHITSPYLHFDTTCIVAIVLLVITPLFLVPLFLPVIVYLHMDKDVMVIQSRQVQRPPRRHHERLSHPHLMAQERAPTNTPTPTIPADDAILSNLLVLARSHYSSVLDSSVSLVANIWENVSVTDNTENTQIMEMGNSGPSEAEEPREDVGWEMMDIPEVTDYGDNELPSYREVEDLDLPSYEDLGTKRLKIGTNVIVVDKDFQVSTFKTASNV